MSASRKQVRDWFKEAIETATSSLGKVYTSRWSIIGEDETDYVLILLEEGNTLPEHPDVYSSQMSIVINQAVGDDDTLDTAAEAIQNAVVSHNENVNPSPFDFFETGYVYGGDSDDPTTTLALQLRIEH